MSSKRCNQCFVEKDVKKFSPKGNAFASQCKECKALNRRSKYQRKNPVKNKNATTQICSVCKLIKSINCFYKNSNCNSYRNDCKECQAISNSKRKEKMAEFIKVCKNKPCMDCKIKYPSYVMDFDHRDEEIKNFNLSAGRFRSLDLVMEEINKCDVICSNCHRERTHNRLINLSV